MSSTEAELSQKEVRTGKFPVELIQDFIVKKGRGEIKMYGSSMSPILSAGGKATIQATANQKISVGDIVCFKFDSYLRAHRVVQIRNNYFVTKGDNWPKLDESILKEQILGKVIVIGQRPITGFHWWLLNFVIARISLCHANIIKWRQNSKIYRWIHDFKTKLGIKQSFYSYVSKPAKFIYHLALKTANRLCSNTSNANAR